MPSIMNSQEQWSNQHYLSLIDNYIYIYHLPNDKDTGLGRYCIIPSWPENISDSMQSTFAQTNALSRSAPVFSYSNSGPRTVQISLKLHRDLFQEVNYKVSNLPVKLGDDYVDTLVNCLQACALPRYDSAAKSVMAPKVAVRFGNQLFIKGVIIGSIGVTWELPILEDNRYATISIAFTIYECDIFSAQEVAEKGSFRGLCGGDYWNTNKM